MTSIVCNSNLETITDIEVTCSNVIEDVVHCHEDYESDHA